MILLKEDINFNMKTPEKDKTLTMTHQIALNVNARDRRLLRLKFRGLRELYNTLLGFLLKQDKKRQKDPIFIQNCQDYREVKLNVANLKNRLNQVKKTKPKIEKGLKEKDDLIEKLTKEFNQKESEFIAIKTRFDDLANLYHLTLRHCEKMATDTKNTTWIADHLDGDSIQIIAKRVFRAYFEYKTGKRGKPRFKTWKNGIHSIEGKKNACISMTKQGKIKWKNLTLSLLLDRKDKDGVQAHALNSQIKFCRIVVRDIKGCQRYFVQLVLKNSPLLKAKHQGQLDVLNKTVGLDIGVSTVAVASDRLSEIIQLGTPHQRHVERKIARYQRKMAKSLRIMNPDCFEPDRWVKKAKHTIKKQGKNIKGKRATQKSQNYLKWEKQVKDLQRKNGVTKTQTYHALANEILHLGGNIHIEKNNFKAWQRGWFGKTLQRHSPAKFQEILHSKVLKTGGCIEVISPVKPCFSQYCHRCQHNNKKPLSQRTHTCCDIDIQRDLYSAFLIQHYNVAESKHGATETEFNLFLGSLKANRHLLGFLPNYFIREENPIGFSPITILLDDRKKPNLAS